MNKRLKRYTVDGLDSEVYAISVVEYPAIESDFIALEKEKRKPVYFESDEKRMLYGAVLIPDLPIYRYDEINDFEFEIVFSKQAIEQLSQRYMRQLNATNWTTDHERQAVGLFTSESWIKSDMDNDKSIALGLDSTLPVGTWFVGCKVDNDETWQRVKRGDFSGFSVESFVSLDEMNFASTKPKEETKNNEEMTEINETFWERLKNVFTEVLNSNKQEEVVEQPAVEEKLEEDVKQDEPEATVTEEVKEEANLEEEQPVEEVVEETAEDIEAKQNLEAMEAKIADLEDKLAKVLEQNAELKKENEKLSAQPSVKPINAKSEKRMDTMDIIRSLHEGTYAK